MISWWIPPLLAIQFLTRLPVPGLNSLNAETAKAGLVKSVVWFPVVGAMVGTITAATILVTEQFWPRVIAVIVALIVEARLTGAFHEDAVADFCDGFGGGMTPQRIHEIMKDSRIGSYGAVGLGLAMALRASLLIVLPPPLVLPALLASASFGRWLAVAMMATTEPFEPTDRPSGGLAKDIGARTSITQWLAATGLVLPFLVPLLLALPTPTAAAIGAAMLFLLWFRSFLQKNLGGVTGDCLGFAVYVGQILILLAATAQLP
jgi:adenosylcobinamide-GDP ribazoletransferase